MGAGRGPGQPHLGGVRCLPGRSLLREGAVSGEPEGGGVRQRQTRWEARDWGGGPGDGRMGGGARGRETVKMLIVPARQPLPRELVQVKGSAAHTQRGVALPSGVAASWEAAGAGRACWARSRSAETVGGVR